MAQMAYIPQKMWISLRISIHTRSEVSQSYECDGQDDLNAMNDMVEEYLNSCEIVYGVRNGRDSDIFFKHFTAEGFYKLLNWMGA